MITSPSTTKRLLIPRWRSFASTVASGELAARKQVQSLGISSPDPSEFVRRRENWHQSPSELTAAELVESAIVFGLENVASDAAQFLASVQADVTPLLRSQSQQLLARLHKSIYAPVAPKPSIRERLREHPDDAILWVELSLRQIISGAVESSIRSMRTAIKLAPNNRFVLRSAARLFSHLHTPDVGYDLLRRSPSTEYDPWLMSAEIAMAGRVEKRPAFLRKGLTLLENDANATLDFSELAGAAATTFLDGTIPKRQARKLFQRSLVMPTDNAVAQAEWASQVTGERFLDVENTPVFRRAKEAQAMHAYSIGDFAGSLKSARDWISEEPFSGRAYSAAAAAANTTDDYETAIQICQDGIKHDPKSPNLRNSLAFALACSDRLFEAEQALLDIRLAVVDPINDLVATANQGLIALRRGEFAKGEALYEKAITGFRRIGSEHLAVSAWAYFAREAQRADHPRAQEIARAARQSLGQRKHANAERILKQIDTRQGASAK